MKPPLKPLTVAHCDLMETGVQVDIFYPLFFLLAAIAKI